MYSISLMMQVLLAMRYFRVFLFVLLFFVFAIPIVIWYYNNRKR